MSTEQDRERAKVRIEQASDWISNCGELFMSDDMDSMIQLAALAITAIESRETIDERARLARRAQEESE